MTAKRQLPFIPSFQDDDTISVQYRNPHEWIESSYVDAKTSDTEFMGRTVSDSRLGVLYWFIVAVLLFFIARDGYLQLLKGSGFALLAERNKTRTIVTQAHRGIFYDRNGAILVRNSPDFSLVVTPVDLPIEGDENVRYKNILSELLKKSSQELQLEIENHDRYRPFLLADHIPYEKALQLEVSLQDMPGIALSLSEQRTYEMTTEQSMSHIVGYTGRISEEQLREKPEEYSLTDTIGKSGLELAYEQVIRGVSGKKEMEVDALGHEKGVLFERAGEQGSNLLLSLDLNMQRKAESVLEDIMKTTGKKKGVVIVSDPHNGEILAYVSLPSFDANTFARGIRSQDYESLLKDEKKPLLNRGTSGEYPSGSTIKMLVAAAALQEGVVTKKSAVMSTGGIHVGKWFFPDWKSGGHGATNVIKALAESVNTYFYTVGGGYQRIEGLGADRLIDYFKKFGIGEETHVDFQKERSGFLPTPEWKQRTRNEVWYIGDTYHISIGQGDVLVTPLQVNLYTSYFANHGINYEPHIVHAIESKDEKYVQTILPPKEYRKGIIDRQNMEIIREGLRAGVVQGSSRRLTALPVSSAGKTGTAQWSSTKSPHAWFTGWAPYENPELVLTVLVEEGEEGSRTAITVAHDFLQWYFREYKKRP